MDWRRALGIVGLVGLTARSNFRSYRSGIQRILAIPDRQIAPAQGGRLTTNRRAPPP
jgi:hypothetical protein